MTSIRNTIQKFLNPPQPIPPGSYSYLAPPESPVHYRLHLRIDEDSTGILIVNAATVLHLNQTAAEYAYHFIHEDSLEKTTAEIASRYHITPETAQSDYQHFVNQIHILIETPDLDPVSYLDFERTRPYRNATKPYRLDCAITYQLPEESHPDYAPHERVTRELDTSEWKQVIEKCWQGGVPHLIFTGGEPTLRADLVDLLQYCEERGLVTGVISGSLKLAEADYRDQLLLSGLDHLMLIFQPEAPAYWKLLQDILPLDLFTAVHLTLTEENQKSFSNYLRQLADYEPNALSLSTNSSQLIHQLEEFSDFAAELGLEQVWEVPVPYMHLNPITQEVGDQRVLEGAGTAWWYLEPDGDVLPDQSINQPLGNLLDEPFEQILKRGKSFDTESSV